MTIINPVETHNLSSFPKIQVQYEKDKNWILHKREEVHSSSEETLERSLKILKDLAGGYIEEFREEILVPKFLPGPDGSVDLFWTFQDATFVINIPSSSKSKMEFYFKDKDGDEYSGDIQNTGKFTRWLSWLVEN